MTKEEADRLSGVVSKAGGCTRALVPGSSLLWESEVSLSPLHPGLLSGRDLTSLVVRLLCASRLRMASVLRARCGKKRSLAYSGREVRPTQPWQPSLGSHRDSLHSHEAGAPARRCRRQDLTTAGPPGPGTRSRWGRRYPGAPPVSTLWDSSYHITCSPQPWEGLSDILSLKETGPER